MIKLTSDMKPEDINQYSPVTRGTSPVKNECSAVPGLWDSSKDLSQYCTFYIHGMSSVSICIRKISSRITSWHEYAEWYMWNIILIKSLKYHRTPFFFKMVLQSFIQSLLVRRDELPFSHRFMNLRYLCTVYVKRHFSMNT